MEVKTCYGKWIENIQARREKEKNPAYAAIDSWPEKKLTSKRKMVQF